MNFRRAMVHAECAMFAQAGFRERVQRGEPTWEAVQALGENEMEAMLHWVNAVFYLFYQVKLRNARGFEEDLSWVISRDPRSSPGEYAWNVFFLQDARRLLALRARLFPEGGAP